MIFVDTGAFVARSLKGDQYSRRARGVWNEIHSRRDRLVTSNLIISETYRLIAKRAGHSWATQMVDRIYDSGKIEILRSTGEQELEALSYLRRFVDQGVSFTDTVSFALMRAHGIRRAFTFDRHFDILGFERFPLS